MYASHDLQQVASPCPKAIQIYPYHQDRDEETCSKQQNFSHSTTLRDTIMSLTGYMIESIMRGLNIANLGCFNADERLSPILEGCLLGGANVGCYHRCCLPYSRQHNIERDTSGVHPVSLVSDHAKPKVGPFQHHFIASTELRDAECQDQGSHMHRHTYSLSKLTPSTLNQSQA